MLTLVETASPGLKRRLMNPTHMEDTTVDKGLVGVAINLKHYSAAGSAMQAVRRKNQAAAAASS